MVSAPHSPAPRGDRPTHIADLLRLVTRDPGRPRLTWYGDDGERVELSGAVLENWVNKTTNLLVEEFDAGPGTRVVLDLPVHWRTVVWALAAWRVGATVVLVDENATAPGTTHAQADVVVTHRPETWTGSGSELVAVALPALARRFDVPLPAGAVDAASAVMTYGDQVGWAPEPAAGSPTTAGRRETHGELVTRAVEELARTGDALTAPRRWLVEGRTVEGVLHAAVGIWATDGSLVLMPEAAGRDLAALRASERVDGVPLEA